MFTYDLISLTDFNGFYSLTPNWSQVTDVVYGDGSAPNPFNLNIRQTSYSNTGEDYIFLRYRLSVPLLTEDDLYVGIFADWDVGMDRYYANLGGIDFSRNK